jgi:hypothetical protein
MHGAQMYKFRRKVGGWRCTNKNGKEEKKKVQWTNREEKKIG